MPRKGENIYLRKDGRWEGRYIKGRRPDGKAGVWLYLWETVWTGKKKRLVLSKSEIYQDHSSLSVYGNGSFSDWAEFWLKYTFVLISGGDMYAGYRRSLDNHINPAIGKLKISGITPEQIQDAVLRLTAEQLALSTLHGVCRLIRKRF